MFTNNYNMIFISAISFLVWPCLEILGLFGVVDPFKNLIKGIDSIPKK